MARNYTNTECPLYGTKYCSALNMTGCDKCIASEGNTDSIKKDIDAVLAMLPETGVYPFFGTDKCMLCKGETKNKASCYAMIDLGNPEPKHEKRNVLGMKTKSMVGSILPLQLSCCKDCRRRHSTIANLPIMLPLFAGIIMTGLMSFGPVGEAVANIHMALPLILTVAVVGTAWIIGKVAGKNLAKRYSNTTWLKVLDIPGVDELAKRNWFELREGRHFSKLIFSKEPLKQGLLTGPMAQEENI